MDAQPVSAADLPPQSGASATPAASESGWPSFHEVLSALNPLQYVPVVGTIYRAITGDTIPEALRVAGSFVVSALTGGPIGMILNAATIIAEKVTGIDPEAIAHNLFGPAASSPQTASAAPAAPIQEAGTPAAEPAPWTAAQMAAYVGDAFRPLGPPHSGSTTPAPRVQLPQVQHLAGIASYRRSLLT